MRQTIKKTIWAAAIGLLCCMPSQAQNVTEAQQAAVQEVVAKRLPDGMLIGKLKAQSVALKGDTIAVDLSENFGDVPFTEETVEDLKGDIRTAMGAGYATAPVALTIAGSDISQYFSNYEQAYSRKHSAFISEQDKNRHYSKGLDGNIVAVWPSHGWYFEPKLNRWEWQRARMFQTVEDMYTHSYVIPFLMPMLENAGAYVWDARERDTHNFGAVVDNDGSLAQSGYHESNGKRKWESGKDAGFAYKRETYKDFENPFEEGTYRMVKAEKDKKKVATATWDVDMPEAGDYALYISYKSLPNSVKDAVYTVKTAAGERRFTVDQSMGGGVWVYLGTFPLQKGMNKSVLTLTNLSAQKDGVVTADAMRVGGGKGNIVRRVALPTEENKALAAEQGNEACLGKEGVDYDYVGSGEHPWFHIGSRYYLQWAGFPKSVYSTSNGINDYNDDYRSRGEWVNWLAGGSEALPNREGLKIPVDISFCLHTDAGTTPNDDIIGTLLIYCTKSGANGSRFGKYANGTPRELSRRLADLISTEVVTDVRAKYEPNWKRRGMWDKSYYEARVPEVPAVLMELLSHQNFADMKYGLDPVFRFDVSRAIYKGILKFIAQRDHRSYVVQPLPINSFAIDHVSGEQYLLTWKPTADTQSTGADATSYIVCERIGTDGAWREVGTTRQPSYSAKINDNKIHSFRIIAVNDGGRSFPSEALSCGNPSGAKGTVLVVNGFTRISGPDWFESGEMAGFYDAKDHGVPYMQQINYLGSQHEFRRNLEWRDDDAPGFGACRSNHETEVIAGNTFDYPATHGEALMQAGYAFTSVSMAAFEQMTPRMGQFKAVDLILGKQKETKVGRGAVPSRYKIFTSSVMNAIKRFTDSGVSMLVTGSYVGSDIWDKTDASLTEQNFAQDVLGYKWVDGAATLTGEAYTVATPAAQLPKSARWQFCMKLNDKQYSIESPDAVKASDSRGFTWLRYSENNIPAGIASERNGYRTIVVGFPFECITGTDGRNDFMRSAMQFLSAD